MEIEIHRVSCRACNKMFYGATLDEAKEKHQQHIRKCPTILGWEKVARFHEKAEKILGRKISNQEILEILGIKRKSKSANQKNNSKN